jgi:hypothetical protein
MHSTESRRIAAMLQVAAQKGANALRQGHYDRFGVDEFTGTSEVSL